MSVIEQALRQIDLQREPQPSSADMQGPGPIGMGMASHSAPPWAPQPAHPAGRWKSQAIVLGTTVSLLAVVAGFSLRPTEATAVALAALTGAAGTTADAPAVETRVAAPLAGDATLLQEGAVPASQAHDSEAAAPRATWLVQASNTWDSGAHKQAARQWIDGLRQTAPSTLALLMAEQQTLEQAQGLHQAWAGNWPVVILAQASPTGPRWMVLALPQASDVGAVQQQLLPSLGRSVPWASVVHWVAKADGGLAVAATPAAPEAPAAPAAPAAPVSTTTKTTAATVVDAAPAPPAYGDAPRLSHSHGAAPDDQTRAAMATKAIDGDFSAVEQWLTTAEFDKALGAAERLEGYMGSTWRTRYLAGVALSGLGRWGEAVSALASALQKNPGHARAALYLAVAQQETGDHTGAIDTLLKATASHPEVPELWLNQGHSMQAQGRSAESAQAYRRFLDISAGRSDLGPQRSWVSKRLQGEG